ncbi:MAG: amino acid permease [Pyrinomonadaceae bacterium]
MDSSSTELSRRYGLLAAVTIIVGQVIAVGIFLVPAGMARSVGSPGLLLAIWLLIGLMTLCGALCYSELSSRFPEAGGSYVYLRAGFGDKLAFLYGWMVLLVLDPGLTAIFAIGLTSYVDRIVAIPQFWQPIFSAVVVIGVATLNIVGTRTSSVLLSVLTWTKILFLFFIVVYGFLGGRGDVNNLTPFFATPPDLVGAMAGGLVGAFFSFAGWWELTRIAGEIRDPQRNLPRALLYGVLALTTIYVAVSAAFMYLVPVTGITSDETFAAQVGEVLFGTTGEIVFSLIVIASVGGTLIAYMMVSPRVYYAMAKDRLFFKSVATVHPRFGTPLRAIAIQALLAVILILSGSFQQIISYFFFVAVLFIGLTVASLFWIRKQPHDGFKTPLYPLTPIVFLSITAVVLFFIAMRDPVTAFSGVGLVLLGLPVYYYFRSKRGQMNGVD